MNPKDYIPKPCHENWNEMTGDERQRFCQKCSTHVHDLTGMSGKEVLALREKNGGKLCGSFRIKKPLMVGTSIASLALAACTPDKVSSNAGESASQAQATNEKVSSKSKTASNNKKKSSSKTKQKEEKKKPILLGKVCPPDKHSKENGKAPKVPEEPEILLGDVCPPEEPPDPKQPKKPEAIKPQKVEPQILGMICPPEPPKKREPKNEA